MKIYLACPYSDPDPKIRQDRFDAVSKAASEIMQMGHVVFSPISHSHPIAKYMPEQGYDFWLKQNAPFLEWADELWILCIEGWFMSKGVQWEITRAGELGKLIQPVWFKNGCLKITPR